MKILIFILIIIASILLFGGSVLYADTIAKNIDCRNATLCADGKCVDCDSTDLTGVKLTGGRECPTPFGCEPLTDKPTWVLVDDSKSLLVPTISFPSPTMSISVDGQVSIDGVPIEKLSDPEIKESMKKIAYYMQESSWISQFDRQTTYLLQELEKCQKNKPVCIKDSSNLTTPLPRKVYACDTVCKTVVKSLRQQWGTNAEIYWNENNFVVISKEGYVNEFKRDSSTIHTGFIK
jgi:hypothetical protein